MILLRALVLRWIARHRLRAALAVLAVALGVAAFLGSVAVGDSIERTATAAVAAISGGADLSVEGGDAGVPPARAGEIRRVEGVAAASPVVLGSASVRGVTAWRVLVVGVDPLAEAGMRRYGQGDLPKLADPLAFLAGTGAVVTRPLADDVGAELVLETPSGPTSFAVAGVVAPRGPERAVGGRVAVMTLAAAQRVLGRGANADRIDVALAPGADAAALAQRIEERLAPAARGDLEVGPPRGGDTGVADVLGTVKVALRIGAAVALLVGMFLVHHTIAVGVAERRREVGVLRALGATRSQVRRVFAAEALALGALGSVIGVALGTALAAGALRGFAGAITSAYFEGEPAPVHVSVPLALTGIAAGAFVALAAAWFPADRAASQPPSDAIRRGSDDAAGRRLLPASRVALLCAAAAGSAAFAATSAGGTFSGYASAALFLVAFLAAAPALLALGARCIAPLLARGFGVPGRLAADELRRHPARAALPAAALAFGIALVVENAGVMRSMADATVEWMQSQIAGDLFVSSGSTVIAAGTGHTPLDASLRGEIARIDGVLRVVGVRMRHARWRGTRVLVFAFELDEYRGMARLDVRGGGRPRDEILAQAARGGACLVSENFALLHGVRVGDAIEMPGAADAPPLTVLGTFDDFAWPRGTVLVDRALFARVYDDPVVDEFSVKLAPGADAAAVSRAIRARIGGGRDVAVTSAAELRQGARDLLSAFFRLAYAQVAAALTVAFLGVVNAMWIAVVLRQREIGLLRAVGATRGQVARSIVVESAALGVIGAALGLVGGAVCEWLALARIIAPDTGWSFPLRFPWDVALGAAALGVVTSALAGLVPGRAAGRFPLREAVAGE